MIDNKALDNWNLFTGSFLKATDVSSENDAFVCVGVDLEENEDKPRLILSLERNQIAYKFDVNRTNASKFKELGILSPRNLIGKKIYFKKVLVRNPQTNKEVDGLRIYKLE